MTKDLILKLIAALEVRSKANLQRIRRLGRKIEELERRVSESESGRSRETRWITTEHLRN